MNKSYFVVITTEQILEVQAPSEEAAIEAVDKKLKAENPRAVYRLQVAKEVEINNNE